MSLGVKILDLQEHFNPPGSEHCCDGRESCPPYIINESGRKATVVCPKSGYGLIFQKVGDEWIMLSGNRLPVQHVRGADTSATGW